MTKKGLEGVALKKRGSGLSLVAAVRDSSNQGLRTVLLEEVSPNPTNPKWRTEGEGDDFEQLLASVATVGVLQPLLLVSADAWRTANPGEVLPVETASWVALEGNRRLLAARTSNISEVPAFIRDDFAGESDSILLHANGGRAELSPIDQATAYKRLLDSGFTQSRLAKELGVSQATISKRVALLKLPAAFQTAVSDGRIPVNEAFEVASEPLEVLEAAVDHFENDGPWIVRVKDAVRSSHNEIRRAEVMRRTGELAEELSVPLVEGNPRDARPALQKVTEKKKIAEARKEGTLRLYAGWDDPEYYVLLPKEPRDLTVETHDRKARKARWPFVVQLATQSPKSAEFRSLVVKHFINASMDWDVGLKLMRELGISTADSRWALEKESAGKNQEKIAWCLIVGAWERGVRGDNCPWGDSAAAFYNQLVALGHQPGEWEQEKLKKGQSA